MSRLSRFRGRALALSALLVFAAACSSAVNATTDSAGGPVSVNIGTQTLTVHKPMRIAYFAIGNTNAYLAAFNNAVSAAVKKIPGASLTVFNGQFSAETQFDQLQNALASKKYNAAIIDPDDGNLLCNEVTKAAPASGVAMVVIAAPVCGREGNGVAQQYAPGTLSYVGGNDTWEYFQKFLEYMVKQNPGPQRVLVLTGPALFGVTENLQKALHLVEAVNPDFKVVAEEPTDYSILQGQTQAQAMIQAHPNATILFSDYSDVTHGAVEALQAAGKIGQVKVYDKGASSWVISAIKAGTVVATSPYNPASNATTAVQLLEKAFDGQTVPRSVANDGVPLPAGADPVTGMYVIDKSNLGTYTPQY
jgi:ribose transport system substrate-binding protein